MLEQSGLSEYFDIIRGWDGTAGCNKAAIIKKVLTELDVCADDAILVGDSKYDRDGAEIAGTDFLGVSYGFGIGKKDIAGSSFPIVEAPEDIFGYITDSD